MSQLLSVVIPARNEPYLQNTIDSLLGAAKGEIEVIAVLDGYWPDPPIKDDSRVKLIHSSKSKGMRPSINAAARLAKGKYLMKCDAHCAFEKGFDLVLAETCEYDWTVVPRRYNLDIAKWHRGRQVFDFQYISHPSHPKYPFRGNTWQEYEERTNGAKIVDLMTSQGSCWFMHLKRFWDLGGLDDVNYGVMGKEAQETCLKTWLSGGRYVLNRNTWYAHWRKPAFEENPTYKRPRSDLHKSTDYAIECWMNNKWEGQTRKLEWLIEKFKPVPTWHDDLIPEAEKVKAEADTEPVPISFFTDAKGKGSAIIRGIQIADYLNAKLNDYPSSGNRVYVKHVPDRPSTDAFIDIIDKESLIPWIKENPQVGVIVASVVQRNYLEKELKRKDINFIPQHHCNYENILRTRGEKVRRVGYIGDPKQFKFRLEETQRLLKKKGLRLKLCTDFKTREDVVEFYKKIDIQIHFRSDKSDEKFKNPLKLANAGSFGIPTVAFPEASYVEEFSDCFIPVMCLKTMMTECSNLRKNHELYKEISEKVLKRSEQYHIKQIAPLYLNLKNGVDETDELSEVELPVFGNVKIIPKAIKVNKWQPAPIVSKYANRKDLLKLFRKEGFKVGCEVGVRSGEYSKLMLRIIPGLKLYLIDPYKGRREARAKAKAHKRFDGKNVVFIEKPSLEALSLIPRRSLDFVYIDAIHKYNDFFQDLINWEKRVRKGGIVSGHDYYSSDKINVKEAVDDYTRFHRIQFSITAETGPDARPSWFWRKS